MEAQHRNILRKKVVKKRTGYSEVQIWRKSRNPNDDFPAPVQLGTNAIGWFEDEIDKWLDARPRCYGAEAEVAKKYETDEVIRRYEKRQRIIAEAKTEGTRRYPQQKRRREAAGQAKEATE